MLEQVSILISWLLVMMSWIPVGSFALSKLESFNAEDGVYSFVLSFLAGAAINVSILSTLSLFIPIHATISLFISVISMVLFHSSGMKSVRFLWSQLRTWSMLTKAGFGLFAVLCFATSLLPTGHNDSGLYYIQFMKWIANYPVVPGLANLHDRFGFNSNWHLLNSAFNVNKIGLSNTNDLNALLSVVVGLAGFGAVRKIQKTENASYAVWGILPITFFMLLRFLTSTTPDLPATLIPFIYLSYIAVKREQSSLPLLILLTAFSSTVKVLSALHLIAVFPIIYWVVVRREYKQLILACILGLMVSIPWVARNVVQTGYIIFPMESIDIFSFDWKVPAEIVSETRKMVDVHARFGNYELSGFGKPTKEWLPFWISAQSKTVLLFFILAITNSLMILALTAYQFSKSQTNRAMINLFMTLTLIVSIVFWWYTGPNPRFVYGIVLFYFAYSISELSIQLKPFTVMRFVPFMALIPTLWMFRIVLNEPTPNKPSAFNNINSIEKTIFYPEGSDKCWNHELPCANMNRTDLDFRGADLKDGFRNTNLSAER